MNEEIENDSDQESDVESESDDEESLRVEETEEHVRVDKSQSLRESIDSVFANSMKWKDVATGEIVTYRATPDLVNLIKQILRGVFSLDIKIIDQDYVETNWRKLYTFYKRYAPTAIPCYRIAPSRLNIFTCLEKQFPNIQTANNNGRNQVMTLLEESSKSGTKNYHHLNLLQQERERKSLWKLSD